MFFNFMEDRHRVRLEKTSPFDTVSSEFYFLEKSGDRTIERKREREDEGRWKKKIKNRKNVRRSEFFTRMHNSEI